MTELYPYDCGAEKLFRFEIIPEEQDYGMDNFYLWEDETQIRLVWGAFDATGLAGEWIC